MTIEVVRTNLDVGCLYLGLGITLSEKGEKNIPQAFGSADSHEAMHILHMVRRLSQVNSQRSTSRLERCFNESGRSGL